MRNHLRWLFLLLLIGIMLVGCQNQVDINSPTDSQGLIQKNDVDLTQDITNNSGSDLKQVTGCVYSAYYWQTHSKYGPKTYDPVWGMSPENFDEDTEFFTTGKTCFQVMSSGEWLRNEYYNLARQYLALRLNARAGATVPSQVLDAYNKADELFLKYTPEYIGSLKVFNRLRFDFLKLSLIFVAYNNGFYGVKRCD